MKETKAVPMQTQEKNNPSGIDGLRGATEQGKAVELPLAEPFYGTYHYQGIVGAIANHDPNVRNWYLNESVMLSCEKIFLYGFSSPYIGIQRSAWLDAPCFERLIYPTRFLDGYVHELIRNLIDNGYYVNFDSVDDYYLEGKSWYNKRHFGHDGLIHGYDRHDESFHVYAYDSRWVYRSFKVSCASFERGRQSMMAHGVYGTVCGVKTCDVHVDFDPRIACQNIRAYVNTTLETCPMSEDGLACGIVVHEYIAAYLDRLYHGLIRYDKMDWRIFRQIWEHKVFMHERIQRVEEALGLNSELSTRYREVVSEANTMRMLYAGHRNRRRDSVLPYIKEKLLHAHEREGVILWQLLEKAETT